MTINADKTTSDPRLTARQEILAAANRYRLGRARLSRISIMLAARRVPMQIIARMSKPTLLGRRQLQLAVAIVRQHHLVDNETLSVAGFRAAK